MAYYSLKNVQSSQKIKKQIKNIIKYFRKLLFYFFKSDFNIPKNHAMHELQLQRSKFGPCRWFETSAKESKHRFYQFSIKNAHISLTDTRGLPKAKAQKRPLCPPSDLGKKSNSTTQKNYLLRYRILTQ